MSPSRQGLPPPGEFSVFPNALSNDGAYAVVACAGETIADLMARVEGVEGAIVERNGEILPRFLWEQIVVETGDNITIRGGGRRVLGRVGGGAFGICPAVDGGC